eukprot:2613-Heterococcus_DN1.PRE.1
MRKRQQEPPAGPGQRAYQRSTRASKLFRQSFAGFCQEVSKVIAQRSAAAISTNDGGPAFPTE